MNVPVTQNVECERMGEWGKGRKRETGEKSACVVDKARGHSKSVSAY